MHAHAHTRTHTCTLTASAASEENLKKSPEPMCSEIAPLSIGNSTAEVYTTYLRVSHY